MSHEFDPAGVLDAMQGFLDLEVADEHRPGVLTHLQAARRIAAPLLAWPLSDEAEPAPVFCP
jgi:hypothetical protein